MRRLLLSASALTLLSGAAWAADLPTMEAPIEAPVVVSPLWTGAYIGAQLGYAFGGDNDGSCFEAVDGGLLPFAPSGVCSEYSDDDIGSGDDFGDIGDDDDSIFAGLHVGYDHQIGNFVIGGVADVNWLFDEDDDDEEFGDENTFDLDTPFGAGDGPDEVFDNFFPTITVEGDSGIDWYGTARLRAGFAAGNFLIYGTGGLAFGGGGEGSSGATAFFASDAEAANAEDELGLDDDGTTTIADVAGLDNCEAATVEGFAGAACTFGDDDDDDLNLGWSLGAGVEFLATSNFSVGVEYLYVNLGGDDDDGDQEFVFDDGSTLELDSGDVDNDFHTISVRGSYRFGG